jgi:cell division protein FtsW
MSASVAPALMRDSTTATGSRARIVPEKSDTFLLLLIAGLVGLGLILVYSSSSVFAAKTYGDSAHFLRLQLQWAGIGLVAFLVASRRRGEWLQGRAGLLFFGAMVLCALVLVPGIGRLVGGARRWLPLGGLGFQPSELAKLAVVVFLAAVLARRDRRAPEERPSLLVPVLVVQLPVAFILMEPDLGTALVIELIVACMVFAAGLRPRTLVLLGLAALPVVYHLVVGTPFRLQRLLSYIDPWAYRSTVGYQITESLISIGSGGAAGVGLGGGNHKLFFLPEAHTDFIFAILAEELGFVGVVCVLGAFALFVLRGGQISARARTSFDSYLAAGLTALIAVPALFNTCVATGLLPTKGLPLPFLSYGGSNLAVSLAAVGLLYRIAKDGGVREEARAGGRA